MTFRQWLRHMQHWWHIVTAPPWFNDESHLWIGQVGSGESWCMTCGATKYDPDDETMDDVG